MNYVLLLGAGFSRNWGGWLANEAFEYLLGQPEVRQDDSLRRLLWTHRAAGGFEGALAYLQRNYILDPQQYQAPLNALQSSLDRMFDAMNFGYFTHPDKEEWIQHYLIRFDSIFTLNQDALLEHIYLGNDMARFATKPLKWYKGHIPGMKRVPISSNRYLMGVPSWAQDDWIVLPQEEFNVLPDSQPVFKLHGSSKWRDQTGMPLMVMGGDKTRAIEFSPILNWYMCQFEEYLCRPDTQLMVIGYSFRDPHINDLIVRAVKNFGLKFFVIDPLGSGLAAALDSSKTSGAIPGPETSLEEAFELGLIGASRRGLREIFKADSIEYRKLLNFFGIK